MCFAPENVIYNEMLIRVNKYLERLLDDRKINNFL